MTYYLLKRRMVFFFIARLWSILIIDMDLLHIEIYLEIFVLLCPSKNIHFCVNVAIFSINWTYKHGYVYVFHLLIGNYSKMLSLTLPHSRNLVVHKNRKKTALSNTVFFLFLPHFELFRNYFCKDTNLFAIPSIQI